MKKRLIIILMIIFFIMVVFCGCKKKNDPVPPFALPSPETLETYMQRAAPPQMTIDTSKIYLVTLKTKHGETKIELFADKAPENVNNFIFLINKGFYLKTTFHRVEPDFVAQAGKPPVEDLTGPGYYIKDEFHPDLRFDGPGWVAMANTRKGPDTNGSQFFITYDKTIWLNDKNTIIGKVVEGMDAIKALTPKDEYINHEYAGDAILNMTVTGIPESLLPKSQPTPVPRAPELVEGHLIQNDNWGSTNVEHRPLASIPYNEKRDIYQKMPAMVIDVNKSYTAIFKTTKGDITFTLFPGDAPLSVNNFYVLAKLGYWDNFPVCHVRRNREVVTGNPDKTPRYDIGYAVPAERTRKLEKGALGYWLYPGMDKERSSSGSNIVMVLTDDPHGIKAFTMFGFVAGTDDLELAKTLTEEDMVNRVEIVEK